MVKRSLGYRRVPSRTIAYRKNCTDVIRESGTIAYRLEILLMPPMKLSDSESGR